MVDMKKCLENIREAGKKEHREQMKFNARKNKRVYDSKILGVLADNITENGEIIVNRNEIQNIFNNEYPTNLQYALQKELKHNESLIRVSYSKASDVWKLHL